LTDVALPAGRTDLKTTLGIGDLVVHVPYGTRVDADARTSAGRVNLFGEKHSGTGVHEHLVSDSGSSPTQAPRVLVLDARVGIGMWRSCAGERARQPPAARPSSPGARRA